MNNQQIKKYLCIAKGQIEGIIKMIDDDRNCLEISDQLMATKSLLAKANALLIKEYINKCTREVIITNDEKKINEIVKTLEKRI